MGSVRKTGLARLNPYLPYPPLSGDDPLVVSSWPFAVSGSLIFADVQRYSDLAAFWLILDVSNSLTSADGWPYSDLTDFLPDPRCV